MHSSIVIASVLGEDFFITKRPKNYGVDLSGELDARPPELRSRITPRDLTANFFESLCRDRRAATAKKTELFPFLR
jgi:hypothetical protein